MARDGFSSRFGVLAATVGSAVGLGNIWMFPYQVGSQGGAGFLLIYILASLLVGLPLMITELSLGRSGRTDSIGLYRKLAPNTGWWLIGVLGVIAAMLIMAFYSSVIGWVFAYVVKAADGSLLGLNASALKATFGSLVSNPTTSLAWQCVVLIVAGAILTLGVSRGIEATTKRLMPLLLLLLILVAVRSLTLPGAMQGVAFLFLPDFSRINADVVLRALGLAFFKMSLAIGCMTVYGSYFREEQNIPKTALTVMLADLAVSMLAGLAIFPAVFALGFDPARGPALLFETLPAVFQQIPMGSLLMVAFFVLTAFAAIGALLSMVEVPIAVMNERAGLSRRAATWSVIVVTMAIGSLATLSNSTLADVKWFGMGFFDLFDFASSKVLMPICGFLISLFIALRWGRTNFIEANSNHGKLHNQTLASATFTVATRITPVLILVILLVGLWQ